MLRFSPTMTDSDVDPLATRDAADAFWLSIDQGDPISAGRAVCEMLGNCADNGDLRPERLHALLVLDRNAQTVLEHLILNCAAAALDSPVRERQLRHTVLDLSRTFTHAYDRYWQHARGNRPRRGFAGSTEAILVRYFYHRQIELLLQLFRYETWSRGRWRELHDAYRWSKGLAPPVHLVHGSGGSLRSITPEIMYVRILLTQLLGNGQFLAPEMAVARKWIAQWSRLATLHSSAPGHAGAPRHAEFVVDIRGSDGLRRSTPGEGGENLWLDTTLIVTAIDREINSQRDGERGTVARRATLLSKLRGVFAPMPAPVARRGNRNVVALTSVHATIGGLASIFSMLRDESRGRSTTTSLSGSEIDPISIVGVGKPRVSTEEGAGREDGSSAFPVTASFGAPQMSWQLRDRSASGSLLRGRVSNLCRTLPGSLTAFRDRDSELWIVGVVRRLRRLPGSNVEIGVEHLGRGPKPVVLTVFGGPPGTDRGRFPALYIRESASHLGLRIRTLVLPASLFEPGRMFAMSSTGSEVTIRLKGSLEHQADFAWASFDIVNPPPAK